MRLYAKELHKFEARHHYRDEVVKGRHFHYLLCGCGDQTLTLLVGGLGRSILWFPYIRRLEKHYRILTFDYPFECRTNDELIEAIHDLHVHLGIEKTVVIGSSIGGYFAQMYAMRYKENVAAMCLFSTAAFSARTLEGLKEKYGKLREKATIGLVKAVPYSFIKPVRILLLRRTWVGISDSERTYMNGLLKEIYRNYTAREDIYMSRRFFDMLRQKPASREDFLYLRGKILLRLPEDDKTFSEEMQKDLVEMMPGCVLERVRGGHMATMMRPEEYADTIDYFLASM